MNHELISRVDELMHFNVPANGYVHRALKDCKAEIEAQAERIKSLEGEKLSLRHELDVLNESGAGTIQQLQAELAKAREYAPMTDDEIHDVWLSSDLLNATETMRLFQSETPYASD